jgi:hypothetical protein
VEAGGILVGINQAVTNQFIRMFGTSLDQIIDMTLVDADGSVRVVNETNDADLFWALRGAGGGSFGVVVEVALFSLIFSSLPSRYINLHQVQPYQSLRIPIHLLGTLHFDLR